MIKEKLKLIKSGKLSAVDNVKGFIDKIKRENKKMNIVLHVNGDAVEQARVVDEKIKKGKTGKLAGLGFLVKSNINVEGLIANCGSRTLENYKSTYDATVIKKLLSEDAVVLGMANMDEFACGASGENSAFGVCVNPAAKSRVPGGSSSGAASGVAAGFCDFALGSDTGGSIRNPASHCGVVGMKPSYGMVSRYGLVDMAMSFDQIGPLAEDVAGCEVVFDVIKGKDDNDAVSRDFVEASSSKDLKKMKIGVLNMSADPRIWELVTNRIKEVKGDKWKVTSFNLGHVDLGIQTYYPIVYVEFFSGTRKFDGRKYGLNIDEVGGKEVLRRIIGGGEISKAEFAGKYYRRALKAKKIIADEFEKAFEKFDFIILPTVPKLPHKVGKRLSLDDEYDYDALTVLANLAEVPAISVPVGFVNDKGEEVPVGLQILGARGSDEGLLGVAKVFEGEE
tara:strand:+ start:8119 stop:9468 length:1350 start_codon:yes stop_codon:yes gene_type:complete